MTGPSPPGLGLTVTVPNRRRPDRVHLRPARYVGYLKLPGYCRGELYEYDSLRQAACDLSAHAATGPCGDEPYLDLYRVADREMLEAARDFADTGIPFDCMDYRVTHGPRGGAHVERA